jgi:hypothetical protein
MTPNDIVKLHAPERKKILLGFSLFEASRSPGACSSAMAGGTVKPTFFIVYAVDIVLKQIEFLYISSIYLSCVASTHDDTIFLAVKFLPHRRSVQVLLCALYLFSHTNDNRQRVPRYIRQ